MSRLKRVTLFVAAAVLIVLTPLFWLLRDPDAGQLVGASIQAGAGVLALVWGIFAKPPAGGDRVADTGKAEADGGGDANTGVADPGSGLGRGPASAEGTGDSVARGRDSQANTGIRYG